MPPLAILAEVVGVLNGFAVQVSHLPAFFSSVITTGVDSPIFSGCDTLTHSDYPNGQQSASSGDSSNGRAKSSLADKVPGELQPDLSPLRTSSCDHVITTGAENGRIPLARPLSTFLEVTFSAVSSIESKAA